MFLSEAEQNLIYDFIFLQLTRKVLERDLVIFKNIRVKFPTIYVEWLNRKLNTLSSEIRIVKRKCHKAKIKIYEEKKENGISYLVVCRGYEQRLEFDRYVTRNYVLEYMERYIHA